MKKGDEVHLVRDGVISRVCFKILFIKYAINEYHISFNSNEDIIIAKGHELLKREEFEKRYMS